MYSIFYPILFLLFFVPDSTSSIVIEPIENEYLSPEYLFHDPSDNKIYVGLSTYPGIAIINKSSDKIQEIIPMPSSVKGISVDLKSRKLFAAAGETENCLYVLDLNTTELLKKIKTGAGPSDLEIAKRSNLLFVANRFSNDVSVIDMSSHKEIKRIEVLREPVALELSPDEKLLAVANLLPNQASTRKYVAAKITLIDVGNLQVIKNIELPNGSYRIKDVKFSKDGRYLYASHLIGRYNVLTNQIEKGWINTNAITIIDIPCMNYYTTVLLDDIHKGAANPYGIHISLDNKWLFAAISGTNELFIIDRDEMHQKIELSQDRSRLSQTTELISNPEDKIKVFAHPDDFEPMEVLFSDLPKELGFLAPARNRVKLQGVGPSHIISDNQKVYISNYFSDDLEFVDVRSLQSMGQIKIGIKEMNMSEERYGEMLFNSALNCFQQWQSCASCHPGDGRVDGLNWDLMNDGIGNPKNTKSLLFSHETPPTMATGIRHEAETAVRAGFRFIQFFDVSEQDAISVDKYLRSLAPLKSPFLENGKLSKLAKKGKIIFEEKGCKNCHSGTYFTDLKKYDMGNQGKYDKQSEWDTPTLIELWRTAPYMHDGRYTDLENVFKIEKHGLSMDLSITEIKDLTAYLLAL